jgi:hypothetical protein
LSDRHAVDVFTDGEGHLALPVEAFTRIFRPTGCRLDPIEGFPVVWQYTAAEGRRGAVLNVPGFLNGGTVSIASRGWLYERERDGQASALFMPGSPKRMRLSETRHKVVAPDSAGAPLYPEGWSKAAVLRVIRVRFRTIVVLDAEYLLAQVPHLPPLAPGPGAAPTPPAEPSGDPSAAAQPGGGDAH